MKFRMAKRSQRKKVESTAPLPWILWTSIVLILLIAPLLFFRREIWVLDGILLWFPLEAEVFDWIPQLLANHRIVFPHQLAFVILGIQSFLPLGVLISIFFLIRGAAPGGPRFNGIVALISMLFIYRWALPGTSHPELWRLLIALLIIYPLLSPLRTISVWIIITLGVGCSFSFSELRPLLFWTALSFGIAKAISFIFILRLRPSRKHRKAILSFGLETVGLFILIIWILISILKWNFSIESLGRSNHLPLAFLGGILCVIASWVSPWRAGQWLCLGFFCQGLFFFQTLELPTLIVCLYVVSHLLREALMRIEKKSPKILPAISTYAAAMICFVYLILIARSTIIERTISPDWMKASKAIGDHPSFVVGNGMGVLAQFHSQKFISNDSILLENSEQKWIEIFESYEVDAIVVEMPYLKNIWSEKIKEGLPAKLMNDSLLSRILLYGGQEVKTKTLQLNAIENFKLEKVGGTSDFFIIKKTTS